MCARGPRGPRDGRRRNLVQVTSASVPSADARRVALASAIGTTIEWYDFFIYGTAAATVFGPRFFPQVSPFIGPLDLADLRAEKNGNSITLRWINFSKNKTDKAEIFVTEMNQFKEGKAEEYNKVGETLLQQENFNFTVQSNSTFYKVLLKAPHHYANVWIVDTNN